MYPRPADLRLTTRWTNGHHIVAVAGEIDICTAPAVRAYLLDTVGAIPGNGNGNGDGRGGGDLVARPQRRDVHGRPRPVDPDLGRP